MACATVVVTVAVAACSSSSTDGGTGTVATNGDGGPGSTDDEGGSADGGATDSGTTPQDSAGGDASDGAFQGDAAALCPTFENTAGHIFATNASSPMPAAKGGTIVAGTYFLMIETAYDAPSDSTHHFETLVIANGTMASVREEFVDPVKRDFCTYSTSGTSLTRDRLCPTVPKSETLGYDATPTTLVIYDTAAKIVKSYERQ